MSEQRGRVEGIFLADAHGSQPCAVAIAFAHAGRGLEGDRHFDDGDACDISLIEAEAIENMRVEHGIDLSPGDARRQLVVRGVDLADFIGRRFQVGEVECEGEERCEPCNHLAGLVRLWFFGGCFTAGSGPSSSGAAPSAPATPFSSPRSHQESSSQPNNA